MSSGTSSSSPTIAGPSGAADRAGRRRRPTSSCSRSATTSWRCTRAARSPSAAATTSTALRRPAPGLHARASPRSACKIKDDPALARRYTSIRHFVAIVTDGTAVLGLGDIGPHGGHAGHGGQGQPDGDSDRPLGHAHPPRHQGPRRDRRDRRRHRPDLRRHPARGHLRAPLLRDRGRASRTGVDIPVMHDDQHGTACVVTAALLNADQGRRQRPGREPHRRRRAGRGRAGHLPRC